MNLDLRYAIFNSASAVTKGVPCPAIQLVMIKSHTLWRFVLKNRICGFVADFQFAKLLLYLDIRKWPPESLDKFSKLAMESWMLWPAWPRDASKVISMALPVSGKRYWRCLGLRDFLSHQFVCYVYSNWWCWGVSKKGIETWIRTH